MELIIKLDRCGYQQDIEEIFVDYLRDLFLLFDIDYDNDFDHRDRGTLADSIIGAGFSIEHFPDVNGFKVFKNSTQVGEFFEVDRILKKENGILYYEFTFEVWAEELTS
jgi:hypothetical protein